MANIHGNEAVGRELLLHLAKTLLRNYGQDQAVRRLLENTDISLLPAVNPDGFKRARWVRERERVGIERGEWERSRYEAWKKFLTDCGELANVQRGFFFGGGVSILFSLSHLAIFHFLKKIEAVKTLQTF